MREVSSAPHLRVQDYQSRKLKDSFQTHSREESWPGFDIYFFFILFYFFFNLWWILSYIEMKQPWVYMCSPSRSPPPPPSPPAPSRSSQCTRSEHLSHASNLGWWSEFRIWIQIYFWLQDISTRPLPLGLTAASEIAVSKGFLRRERAMGLEGRHIKESSRVNKFLMLSS